MTLKRGQKINSVKLSEGTGILAQLFGIDGSVNNLPCYLRSILFKNLLQKMVGLH
jgi:hypothetical protein